MPTDKKTSSNVANIDLSGYETPGYEAGSPYPPNDKHSGYYPDKPDSKYPGHCPTAPDDYPDYGKHPKSTFANKLKKMLHQKVTVYTVCKIAGASSHDGHWATNRGDCCHEITGQLTEVGDDYIVLQTKDRWGREKEICLRCRALIGITLAEHGKYNNQETGVKTMVDHDKVPEL